jgi:uncharacterized membrane protein YkvA (DUF1232 family)
MTENLPVHLPDRESRDDNEETVRGFWDKIRRFAGQIPFAEEAVTAWFCARDPATPSHVRAALVAALAYFVIPMDALPDFLPALGFTDDAALFWAVWQMMKGYITEEHREKAAQALDGDARWE